ncbi:MAG: LysR family transcriptional regulator [Gammaproteobacteria bacterium]|nr:LysR family transcriptional regulator [Gammaproteobacteria bacterium]
MQALNLLDTNLLNAFVTIAEAQSLTDAAKRLGITQSAVSQTLRQLEQTLGVELVVRRTSPVRLTVAGNVLKQNADTILGELRRLNAAVREAAETGFAQCRLGLVTSFSEVFGSKLIASLGSQTERLTLRSGLTPALAEAFLDREIDILISNEPLTDVDGLQRFRLLRDPMLLVAAEGLIENAGSFSLRRLAGSQPMIKYSRNNPIGIYSEVVLRRIDLPVEVRFETDDTHALMNFVRDGHGWAIVSAICLAQSLYLLDGVKINELDKSRHARDIYLLAREGEMGAIPLRISSAIRTIFNDSVYPRLRATAPWLRMAHFDWPQET